MEPVCLIGSQGLSRGLDILIPPPLALPQPFSKLSSVYNLPYCYTILVLPFLGHLLLPCMALFLFFLSFSKLAFLEGWCVDVQH